MLVNNSARRHYFGKSNGAANAVASLSRAFFPTVGGAAWALSLEQGWGYPVTPHLPFLLPLAMASLQLALALSMPTSLNEPLD